MSKCVSSESKQNVSECKFQLTGDNYHFSIFKPFQTDQVLSHISSMNILFHTEIHHIMEVKMNYILLTSVILFVNLEFRLAKCQVMN